MGEFLKKIEGIKAKKARNDHYFLIYFYAIVSINIVADVCLVFIIRSKLNNPNLNDLGHEGWDSETDIPLLG
jgi:hypothetical protein